MEAEGSDKKEDKRYKKQEKLEKQDNTELGKLSRAANKRVDKRNAELEKSEKRLEVVRERRLVRENVSDNSEEDLDYEDENDEAKHKELDEVFDDEEKENAEEIAAALIERSKNRDLRPDFETDSDPDPDLHTEQGNLHTSNDPTIWAIKCMPGMEEEACVQLMRKFFFNLDKKPLLITSVL